MGSILLGSMLQFEPQKWAYIREKVSRIFRTFTSPRYRRLQKSKENFFTELEMMMTSWSPE
jgi:hypothetical protein